MRPATIRMVRNSVEPIADVLYGFSHSAVTLSNIRQWVDTSRRERAARGEYFLIMETFSERRWASGLLRVGQDSFLANRQ